MATNITIRTFRTHPPKPQPQRDSWWARPRAGTDEEQRAAFRADWESRLPDMRSTGWRLPAGSGESVQ
jgi:hypothetical protein